MFNQLVNSPSFEAILRDVLLEEILCGSVEEAIAITGDIDLDLRERRFHDRFATSTTEELDGSSCSFIKHTLQEYTGISEVEAHEVLIKCQRRLEESSNRKDSENIDNDVSNESSFFEESEIDITYLNNDDDSLIGQGACQLCEREDIRLTRHHLIPKSTYNKIEPRLVRAVKIELDSTDFEESTHNKIQNEDGLKHLIQSILETIENVRVSKCEPTIAKNDAEYRNLVQKSTRFVIGKQTIDICRQCHNMIHKTHDNLSLAHNYNTLEKLLQDETIYKHCKWLNKQRRGQYKLR